MSFESSEKTARSSWPWGPALSPAAFPPSGTTSIFATALQTVYLTGAGISRGFVPNDPELPLPLDKVHPLHDVAKIDYFLPGCPPSADAIWQFLTDLMAGRTPHLGHGLIHYD